MATSPPPPRAAPAAAPPSATPELFSTCAFCPRLCRHVCPVAVGTAWESATPTAIMTTVWWAEMGMSSVELAREASSLCLGCGACEAHCKVHVPVPERLVGWLQAHREGEELPAPPSLPTILGVGVEVVVLGSEPDWREPGRGDQAWCRTGDALGFSAWEAGDARVLERVARHFAGRRVVTASLDIARVLTAAGVPVRVLELAPAEGHPRRFNTCFEGAEATPDQLACCGRRAGFPEREPEAARRVAEENVRRLGGAPTRCADASCAAWLRAHGGEVEGPAHHLRGER